MNRILSVFVLTALLFCVSCGQSASAWQEQYDLGVRYLSEGNYEEAIIAFNAAIEIDPKRAEAYIGLADVYTEQGDTEKARETLKRAVDAVGETTELREALDALTVKDEPAPPPESEPQVQPESEAEEETESQPEIEAQPEVESEPEPEPEVQDSVSASWQEILCHGSWHAIDPLPDGTSWISFYDFADDGTFSYEGGWYQSEMASWYSGTYAIGEDGTLSMHYTDGLSADMQYQLSGDSASVVFTQVSERGLFHFHTPGTVQTLVQG